MKTDTIKFTLPPEGPTETPHECQMSIDLFQNARQTMGELRDFIRHSGLSWDFIQSQIDRSKPSPSPIHKALSRMDEYATGPGRSLHDLPSNVNP